MMEDEKFDTLHGLISKAVAFHSMVEESKKNIANAETTLRMEQDGLARRERVYNEAVGQIKAMGYHDLGHARGEINKELKERGHDAKL